MEAADRDNPRFDILYVSYGEVRKGAPKELISTNVFRPERGLWYLSGYVWMTDTSGFSSYTGTTITDSTSAGVDAAGSPYFEANGPLGVQIDGSGNVWTTLYTAVAEFSNSGSLKSGTGCLSSVSNYPDSVVLALAHVDPPPSPKSYLRMCGSREAGRLARRHTVRSYSGAYTRAEAYWVRRAPFLEGLPCIKRAKRDNRDEHPLSKKSPWAAEHCRSASRYDTTIRA
jgi:hypothetical protein